MEDVQLEFQNFYLPFYYYWVESIYFYPRYHVPLATLKKFDCV